MSEDASTSDPIKITGEFTPDPNVCKFMVEHPLVDDWTLVFRAPDESLGSPLVDALFGIEGIVRVKVSGSAVTVTKNRPDSWPEMAKHVVPAIRGALATGEPPVSAEALEAVKNADPADIAPAVEKLFEQHINPALASHGGFVRLVKVEGRDIHLEMGGGCQGCAASQATLRQGIETAIREVVPQAGEIIDATDHAAGTNPYYT